MEIPRLKQICGLIRIYSSYTSNVAIAERLGIKEGTLRGYWETYGGHVPDGNADRFAELVQEIAPMPLSKDAALKLLQGQQLAFHSMLLPIEGSSWRELLNEQLELEITKPPPPALGFGEVEGEDVRVADETVGLNKQFRFRGEAGWAGEGFLAAEHAGEWHLLPLGSGQRSFEFSKGVFDLPLARGNKQVYMIERNKPGFYHYVVIGHRYALPDHVRHQVLRANPYSQLDLDLLGSMILQSNPEDRIVLAATLRVAGED